MVCYKMVRYMLAEERQWISSLPFESPEFISSHRSICKHSAGKPSVRMAVVRKLTWVFTTWELFKHRPMLVGLLTLSLFAAWRFVFAAGLFSLFGWRLLVSLVAVSWGAINRVKWARWTFPCLFWHGPFCVRSVASAKLYLILPF